MTQTDQDNHEFDLFGSDEFANGTEQQPQERSEEQTRERSAAAKDEGTSAKKAAFGDTEAEQSVPEDETSAPFEEEMQELQLIVDRLETGEVPLEEAIQLFQKGMNISRSCHQKLENVEKEVHLLLEEEGEVVNKPFELEEDPS